MGLKSEESNQIVPDLAKSDPEVVKWLTKYNPQGYASVEKAYRVYEEQFNHLNPNSPSQIATMTNSLATYLDCLLELQHVRVEADITKAGIKTDAVKHYNDLLSKCGRLRTSANSIEGLRKSIETEKMEPSLESNFRARLEEQFQELLQTRTAVDNDLRAISTTLGNHTTHARAHGRLAVYAQNAYMQLYAYLELLKGASSQYTMGDREGARSDIVVSDVPAALPSLPIEAVVEKLSQNKPELFQWMQEQGWLAPKKTYATPKDTSAVNPSQAIRYQLEDLVRETARLNMMANELLQQPYKTAKASRDAHLAWETDYAEPMERRRRLKASVVGEELPPRPVVIDVNAANRPYDKLARSLKSVHDFSRHIEDMHATQVNELGPERFLSSAPLPEETDMFGDTVRGGKPSRAVGKLLTSAEKALNDSVDADRDLGIFLRFTPAERSELLPRAKDAVEFCRNEIYPRLRYNLMQIEGLSKDLLHAYGAPEPEPDASLTKMEDFQRRRAEKDPQWAESVARERVVGGEEPNHFRSS